jgi:hypothetical protein
MQEVQDGLLAHWVAAGCPPIAGGKDGDAGGEGSGSSAGKEGGEGSADAGSGEEGAEDDDADGEDADGETPPKGDLHKSKRWKRVHGELKAFKEAGLSPAQLKAALKRLENYDKLAEDADATAEADDDPKAKDLAKKRKAAQKELLEIYPALKHVEAMAERMDTFYTSLERRATSEMRTLMKEAGMKAEPKNLASMSEILSNVIKEDEDLYYEYIGDPRSAVKQAWNQVKGDFEAAARRSAAANVQKNKQGLAGLPKTHRPGGSPEVGGKTDKGPKNLNEARKRVEAKLAAME